MDSIEHSFAAPKWRMSLRSLVGLTEGLAKRDLEQIVVDEIRKYRKLASLPEQLYDGPVGYPSLTGLTDETRIPYIKAMIELETQQTVVSVLLEVLGYIPKVPQDC